MIGSAISFLFYCLGCYALSRSIDGILMVEKEQLRRLLEPAQTSPIDSFKWTDKRSAGQQVAGGFRIVGGLLAGFAVIVVVMGGIGRFSDEQHGLGWTLGSCVALAIAATILFSTANRWAPWVLVFFGPAVPRILAILVFEQDSYLSSHSISRLEVAEFLAYALAVVLLTMRFIGKRPAATTFLDRIALTVFVFAQFFDLMQPQHFLHWPMLLGLTGLFAAWLARRHSRSNHRRIRRAHPQAHATSVAP
jgi:hypothetical protein